MNRSWRWQLTLAIFLLTGSAVFYFFHFVIYKDAHHIFLYLISDIAFLFIDVLIVTLILHRLLQYQEKQSMKKKLNMAIGTFFSEMGVDLLAKCAGFDPELSHIQNRLAGITDWCEKDFKAARKDLSGFSIKLDSGKVDLEELKIFLISKRTFLLNLLQNQNLLEHETFTDALWAVFHLTDELAHRKSLIPMSPPDRQHLSGDMVRAYHLITLQWLDYVLHLKNDYPCLYSLAVRRNPFDPQACVELV